ncbi:MAG: hypothetical protein ACXWPV_05690, partial [Candidatus Limnocylindrales bacterium]
MVTKASATPGLQASPSQSAEGGDKAKVAELQKQADDLIASEKPYVIKDDLWTLYMKNGGTA